MCGIWARISSVEEQPFGRRALSLMSHRGPDAEGFQSVEIGRKRIELGHRRLAIIDLKDRSNQPMWSECGRFALVFNGEIYNYRELRSELSAAGMRFQTESDTEVLLQGLRVFGRDFVKRLVGMFAFVFLDQDDQIILFGRDPFGIKPLYYAFNRDNITFASEPGPLLELPEVSRRGNLQAAYNYLVFNRTDADTQTFFEDILQFPPGATARIDLGNLATGLQIQRYWDPSCSINRPCSDERCGSAEQLRELLLQSVKLHLRSDVEVGAALSGGVDSSGLVAGIREIGGPALAIKAFCFAAGECGDDESGWARLAAAEADADLTTIPASPDRFIADLDAVIRSQGEPFGSTSIHAQYSVMRAAAEKGVKVMIDGQGADELFAGYRPFLSAMIAEMLADARGLSAWQLANDVADGRKSAFMFLMQAVVKSLPQFIGRYLRPFGAVPLKPGWINIDYLAQHSVVFEPPTRRFADDELVADLAEHVVAKTLPALLRFEDRNSMAFSIESRVPFLTTAIADFAYSLASNKLISSKGGYKTILREALRGLVPDAILDRRDKVGFAAPQKHWLMQADDWIASVLSETAFSRGPLLDQRQTVDVVRRGISSGDDSLAWRCLNLLRWSVIYNVRYPK